MKTKKTGIDIFDDLISTSHILLDHVGRPTFGAEFSEWRRSCDGAIIRCEALHLLLPQGIEVSSKAIRTIIHTWTGVRDGIANGELTFNDSYYQVGFKKGNAVAQEEFAARSGRGCLDDLMLERSNKIRKHIPDDYGQGFEEGYRRKCAELIESHRNRNT